MLDMDVMPWLQGPHRALAAGGVGRMRANAGDESASGPPAFKNSSVDMAPRVPALKLSM
jgi:hypothetical protein